MEAGSSASAEIQRAHDWFLAACRMLAHSCTPGGDGGARFAEVYGQVVQRFAARFQTEFGASGSMVAAGSWRELH